MVEEEEEEVVVRQREDVALMVELLVVNIKEEVVVVLEEEEVLPKQILESMKRIRSDHVTWQMMPPLPAATACLLLNWQMCAPVIT